MAHVNCTALVNRPEIIIGQQWNLENPSSDVENIVDTLVYFNFGETGLVDVMALYIYQPFDFHSQIAWHKWIEWIWMIIVNLLWSALIVKLLWSSLIHTKNTPTEWKLNGWARCCFAHTYRKIENSIFEKRAKSSKWFWLFRSIHYMTCRLF